jgi:transcriptional regulator with XRE-family HTH domain
MNNSTLNSLFNSETKVNGVDGGMLYSVMEQFSFQIWLEGLVQAKGDGNKAQLGRLAGMTGGHIGNMLSGEREPTDEVLRALAKVAEVDPEWLIAQVDGERLAPRIERIRKYAPELLAPVEAANALTVGAEPTSQIKQRSLSDAVVQGETLPRKAVAEAALTKAAAAKKKPTTPPKGMPDFKKLKMRPPVVRAAGDPVDQDESQHFSEGL